MVETILKWTFRAGFVVAGITAFVILANFAFSLIGGLESGIVGDLLALVQIWLPFNLGVLIGWLFSAAGLYVTYRFAVLAVNYMSRLTA